MKLRLAFMLSMLVPAIIAARLQASDISSTPWEFREVFRSPEIIDSYLLPTGPFRNGELDAERLEGKVSRVVLQADGVPSTLELLNAIWSGFANDGFELMFNCKTEECGGFEFRMEFDVADPPGMYVDLGDFRLLSASRQIGDKSDYIVVLTSLSGDRGFVQLDAIGDFASSAEFISMAAFNEDSDIPEFSLNSFAESLLANDRVVLEGLEFKSGSAELGDGTFAALEELADFMRKYPAVGIFLVGHTDNSGSMEANVKISKMRAASVLEKLVDQYGVERSRLNAEGIGFLMPMTANATEEGRNLNRRVEAVIAKR